MSTSRLAPNGGTPGLLSVVIPAWNLLELTQGCVASVRQARLGPATATEVVVVDNGSDDGTAAWLANECARDPMLRVVRHPHNRGFAAAANAGLMAARGEFLCVLNNDTLLASHAFERMLLVLQEHASVGLVVPVSNYVAGRQHLETPTEPSPARLTTIDHDLHAQSPCAIEDTEFASGLCMLATRRVLERTGLFDERFGTGNFEDADLALRMRCAGLRLLIARDAYVHHFGSRTFDALGLDHAREIEEKHAIFTEKWYGHSLHEVESALGREDYAVIDRHTKDPDPAIAMWHARCDARAAEARGDLAAARHHWENVLAARPMHIESRFRHAICLLLEGHVAAANSELAHAHATFAHSPRYGATIRTRVAQHLRSIDATDAAWGEIEHALELWPRLPIAVDTKAAWLIEDRRFGDAERLLRPCTHANSRRSLGIALMHQGRAREAQEEWRRAGVCK